MNSLLLKRFRALPAPALEDQVTLTLGGRDDYRALAKYHYRAAQPATISRVLALHPSDNDGQDDRGEPIGVLVESLPTLCCSLRDAALENRYGAMKDPWQRARLLGAEVRCISRVIIHPQWRGLGLAVRLVRHALATADTIYTEAMAVMGHTHPFFATAGMIAYHRNAHPHDARLLDALAAVKIAPAGLCRPEVVLGRIGALPRARRTWLGAEL